MTEIAVEPIRHDEPISRRALGGITIAIVLWTSNVLFVRQADEILVFTVWRMLFAVPVLAVTAGILRFQPQPATPRPARARLGRSTRIGVVAIGVLFGISAFVNFVAINETTLVNVGVIHALQPAVVAVIAGRYLGEVVDRRLIVCACAAIAGACLVAAASTGVGTWSLHGDLLAVLGLGLNSGWFLAGRWVRTRTDLDATTYMAVVFSAGAAALLVVALLSGRSLLTDGETYLLAAMTALFGTIGHTIVAWAHRFVPAAVSSLFILSQPALIAVLAWLAFDEPLRAAHLAGGVIVLASLGWLVTKAGSEAAPPPAPAGELPDVRDEELPA